MNKKDTSRVIEFLLNNEEETEEDAREYLKMTGADSEEMIRKVMEVLEGRSSGPDKSGFREEHSTDGSGRD